MLQVTWVNSDGGRQAAGYKGDAGDCVARAIAIATGLDYQRVYMDLAAGNGSERRSPGKAKRSTSARNGINTTRKWFKVYMDELGFDWVPCMGIGTGCTVHLCAEELPPGRLVVMLSRHSAAVIDGVLYDTYDCSRDGTRCVYGYWQLRKYRHPVVVHKSQGQTWDEVMAAHG